MWRKVTARRRGVITTPANWVSCESSCDADWMTRRKHANALDAPIAIYEVHLGSWRRNPDQGNRWLTYREMANELADYVVKMGYTHVISMDGGWRAWKEQGLPVER